MTDPIKPATDEEIALRKGQFEKWPGTDISGEDRWRWERSLIARIEQEKARADAAEQRHTEALDFCESYIARLHKAEKRIAELEAALRKVETVGHNLDCLFCGFKDKAVKEVLADD